METVEFDKIVGERGLRATFPFAVVLWTIIVTVMAVWHYQASYSAAVVLGQLREDIFGFSGLWAVGIFGLLVGRYQLQRQLSRRRQAVEALRVSEEHYRTLVEQASDGIFIAGPDGKYIDANSSGCAMLGYTRDEILTKRIVDIIPPEDLANAPLRIDELRQGKSLLTERRLIRKDGTLIPIEISARMLPDGSLQAIHRDITERTRVEERLNMLKHSIDVHYDGAYWMDSDNRFVYINEVGCRALGYEREELIGRALSDVNPNATGDGLKHVWERLRNEGFFSTESIHRRKDGSEFPVEIVSTYVQFAGREYNCGFARDISERKRVEEVLQESGRRYRSLFENMLDGYAYCRMLFANGKAEDFIYVEVNQAFEELTGLKNVIGKRVSEVIPGIKESNPELFEIYGRVALTGAPERFETYLETLGIWFSIAVYSPEREHFVAVFENITEQKRSEIVLRENEELYRTLVSASPDAITMTDEKGIVVFASENALKLFGCASLTEVLGRNVLEWVVPEELDKAAANIQFVIANGRPRDTDYTLLKADGTRFSAEINAAAIRRTDDNLRGLILITRDVTDRERAERELSQSEARYRAVLKSAKDAIVSIDASGIIVGWNNGADRVFGYRYTEAIGQPLTLLVPQFRCTEHIHIFDAPHSGAESSAVDRTVELVGVCKDGSEFPLEFSLAEWEVEEGRFSTLIIRDITNHKKAGNEIRLLAHALASTRDCVTITDLQDRIIFVNDAFVRTYGFSPKEVYGKEISIVRSSDAPQELSRNILSGSLNGGWHGELLNRRKDGTVFPVELWASMVKDEGKHVGWVGVARDITQRTMAEEALRASETRYRHLIEKSTDGIFIADENGRIILANPRAHEMLGYEADELLDFNIKDTYASQDLEFAQQRIQDIRSGKALQFERLMKRKDGTVFPVDVSMTSLGDGTTQGTVRDITDRRRAEESIRKLYGAIEQSNEVIFMTAPDGTITYVNPSFRRVYGYEREEAIGKTPRILKSGQMNVDDYKAFWDLLAGGKSLRGEIVNKTKTGKLITIETSVSPVLAPDGIISGYIAVQKDVSERKKQEKEHKTLQQQLFQAQKIESIGTLAGGIAHDFNNILGIILGHSSLLQRFANNPEKLSRSAEAITKAVQRGAGLVRQILMFARKSDVTFEPVNLNESIVELEKMIEETFPRVIEFSVQLDENLPLVHADRTQLHQTFLNLCVNARDAMPDGGTISINTKRVGWAALCERFPDVQKSEFICVSISDTGTGMDEATRQRIFEPFFTTKEVGKGTGLGLAVVYGILKSHNGYIDVESAPGLGTTFGLYFPIPASEVQAKLRFVANEDEEPGGNETILLVEDEEMLRQLLQTFLVAKGYKVLTADNGEEAIQIYKHHQDEIAAVVTDMGLPKTDGANVFLQLKRINPDVKVLLASGYIDPNAKSELMKAGIKDFIPKPYVPATILKQIRKLLDGI